MREQLWSDDELPTAAQIRDLAGAVERLVRAHQHLNAAVSDTSATAAVSMVSRLQDALKQVVAADD